MPTPCRRGRVVVLLAPFLLAAFAAPARAVTQLSVFVTSGAANEEDTDGDSADVQEPTANSLSRKRTASVAGASTTSSAAVGYGWARASTSTHSTNDASATGGAQGRFQDELVITAPGVAIGTPGTLRFHATVGGSLTASASSDDSASSSWNVTYRIATGPFTRLVEGMVADGAGGGTQSGELGGGTFVSPGLGFNFGLPFALSVALNVEAGCDDGGVASAQYGNAFEWDGIEVFSGGQPVAGFVVESGSGADWAGPIAAPEPATGALGLAVSCALAGLRARR